MRTLASLAQCLTLRGEIPHRCRAPRADTRLLFGMMLVLMAPRPAGAVNRYIEEFDNTTFKDAAETSADWNTATGTLQLFPFQPSLLGSYDSPGFASRVAYSGTVAYLADGASGLRIVNVASPASPASLGSFDTSGNANDVAISGTVAYVADGVSGLQIINVVNPASPALLGTFNTSGDAKGVTVSGTVAYVADGASGLQIINVSNAASPSLLGTFNTSGDARAVAISGRTAYVADDVSGLQIINVTNSASPSLLGAYNTPGLASGVAVAGTRAYVADDLFGLQIVNASNPASPSLFGAYDTPGNAVGVTVSGTQAYVADAAAGVHAVDVSNPSSPTLLFSQDTPGTANGIAGQGARAFVADGASGLRVVQLGLDPREPVVAGSYAALAGNVTIAGNLAYVAKYTDGLAIFDITDPVNPVPLGTLATPSDAYAVAISGGFAYVAVSVAGIAVIDVSVPANPTLVATCDTPGQAVDVAVSGTSVCVADNFAGLQIIDVSDPASPTLIGNVPTGYGDESIAVDVSGNVAYVANVTGGLTSIDVSNPRNPNLLGSFSTPGYSYGLAVEGTTAYLSTTQLPSLVLAGVLVLNVGNPANPTQLGYCAIGATPGHITLSGATAFVACSTSGLMMIDVSDPRSPENFWTYRGWAGSAAAYGNYVYVTTLSGVDILKVDDPATSSLIGTYDTPGEALDVAISGTVAYVADNTSGLQIIDISNPSSPSSLGAYDTPVQARAVAISGTVAYVADYETLQILDVSNPANPTFLGSYNPPGIASEIAVSGTVAYVACGSAGLQIINVSNPASPILLASYIPPGSVEGVAVSGTVAYLADFDSGLRIINVSNPASPTTLGVYDTYGLALDVAIAGTLAYVADYDFGLLILNVSNPASPQPVGYHGSFVESVTVLGSLAYVDNGGLEVLNVSDPAKPTVLSRDSAETRGIAVSGSVACVACRYDGLRIFQVVEQRFDAARPRGQSLAINGGLAVRRARLTSEEVNDVVWRLSGDGGITWEAATPGGHWVTFEDGADLRWQASLVPIPPSFQASPPEVSRVEVEWLSSHPVIESIRDIAADQGGRVRLRFGRSGYDEADDRSPVVGYQIYHRVDDLSLASEVGGEGGTPDRDEATTSRSARLGSPAAASLERESIRTFQGRTFILGGEQSPANFPPGTWEAVTWVGATQSEAYEVPLATDADSTFNNMGWSVYLVTAHTRDPEFWFASAPDSGYSADNLAPNVPGGFVAGSQGGAGNLLDWDASPDDDFRYFSVYRSTDPGIVHGPENLVHSTTETTWLDPSPGGPAYYKLTARDFAGNESEPAEASVAVGVDETVLPASFALRSIVPNPVRHAATVRFDVPASGGKAQVGIYDVRGRRVRQLVDGAAQPGERSVVWNGRDDRGHRLPAGLYVCRLDAPGFSQVQKLLLVR